jgi:hypothetical protein
MKKYAFVVSSTLLLLAAFPLRADDRMESEPDREEYVRTLTLVEVKGQLSYQRATKGSDAPAGSVRVGAGFGLQVFWLDWSEAPELREQAKKLDSKRVVLLGTLKPPGSGYVALGYSGTVTVRALKEVSPRPAK